MPYTTLSSLCEQHPGKSGIYPLSNALEAFAIRAQICQTAKQSLDIQYYIWRHDLTGTLLLYRVLQAAHRGVQVRLLLDDYTTGGLDTTLAILNQHVNIQVRLINPFKWRRWRYLNLLTEFRRLNHRMHNKSMSADQMITVVGGRNVGDEYFGAKDGDLFSDLDVVATGPIVTDVAQDFERFWNCPSAVRLETLIPAPTPGQHRRFRKRLWRLLKDPRVRPYILASQDAHLRTAWLDDGRLYDWAHTTMLSDSPAKLRGEADPDTLVTTGLRRIFGQPHRHLELVSAYFVPTRDGLAHLQGLARNGVRVQVLTNSLEATDVTAVHAGYARYRKRLLKAGITLFEMQRTPALPRIKSYGVWRKRPRVLGSAGTSLHSKTLSVDGETLFVGSFNFDPRSDALNTELGFVIECSKLARDLQQGFAERVPDMAYQVHLSPRGKVFWTHRSAEYGLRTFNSEPRASAWRRIKMVFFGLLPFEWLL